MPVSPLQDEPGAPVREGRTLVFDTCGDPATLALAEGARVRWQAETSGRSASAQMVPLLAEGLRQLGWTLADLDGIGVVHGPGSFTGMRVGLAIAKGLCLASGKPLALVSRLAVMLRSRSLDSHSKGPLVAVLSAGRGELYALRSGASESLIALAELPAFAAGDPVLFAEESLGTSLIAIEGLAAPQRCRADAAAALPLVTAALRGEGTSLALADAHYVRAPEQTFKRPAGRVAEPIAG